MAQPTDRELKLQKVHGKLMVCPKCYGQNLTPNFSRFTTTFECGDCGCEFDGDGNTGPFEVTCPEGHENPIRNEICYMCKVSLADAKAALKAAATEPKTTQVRCSNCGEPRRGEGACSRCGEHLSSSGNVLRIGAAGRRNFE